MDIDYILGNSKKSKAKDPLRDLFGIKPSHQAKPKSNVVNQDFMKLFIGQGHPRPNDRKTKQQKAFLHKTRMGTGRSHERFWNLDGDGVISGLDCEPFNYMRHGFIRGKRFPAQIHTSYKDVENLDPAPFPENIRTSRDSKPQGGLWTTKLRKESGGKYTSDWEDFVEDRNIVQKFPKKRFVLRPSNDARIYSMEDEKDYREFEEKYIDDNKFDVQKFRKDYDALHTSKRFVKGSDQSFGDVRDVESTQWFNPKFRKIETVDSEKMESPGVAHYNKVDIDDPAYEKYYDEQNRAYVEHKGDATNTNFRKVELEIDRKHGMREDRNYLDGDTDYDLIKDKGAEDD